MGGLGHRYGIVGMGWMVGYDKIRLKMKANKAKYFTLVIVLLSSSLDMKLKSYGSSAASPILLMFSGTSLHSIASTVSTGLGLLYYINSLNFHASYSSENMKRSIIDLLSNINLQKLFFKVTCRNTYGRMNDYFEGRQK